VVPDVKTKPNYYCQSYHRR